MRGVWTGAVQCQHCLQTHVHSSHHAPHHHVTRDSRGRSVLLAGSNVYIASLKLHWPGVDSDITFADFCYQDVGLEHDDTWDDNLAAYNDNAMMSTPKYSDDHGNILMIQNLFSQHPALLRSHHNLQT